MQRSASRGTSAVDTTAQGRDAVAGSGSSGGLPRSASAALVSSALAGLLGVGAVTGCGDGHSANVQDSRGTAGAPATLAHPDPTSEADAGLTGKADTASDAGVADGGAFSRVLSTTPIAFRDFSDLCEERGGFVSTNANCAGSNLCKGLSYADDGTVLTEHSCKGMNSCMGLSCIDLPKGSGLSGQELYETGPCGGCHNDAIEGDVYVVFTPQGTSPGDAVAAFEDSSDLRLSSIVAFGTQGVNDDGVAFSNMPSYRETYSRAEIEAVVRYIRGLPNHTKIYGIPGEPDGGR
ncbi:MAG TPA: c-type cytochrome [Polyangiaceae bacterium]|jgi:hypothetical protein|nr:c-type cytochrome [Polyangiaceae bacterium]